MQKVGSLLLQIKIKLNMHYIQYHVAVHPTAEMGIGQMYNSAKSFCCQIYADS
jgi:hypothetical protein